MCVCDSTSAFALVIFRGANDFDINCCLCLCVRKMCISVCTYDLSQNPKRARGICSASFNFKHHEINLNPKSELACACVLI